MYACIYVCMYVCGVLLLNASSICAAVLAAALSTDSSRWVRFCRGDTNER